MTLDTLTKIAQALEVAFGSLITTGITNRLESFQAISMSMQLSPHGDYQALAHTKT